MLRIWLATAVGVVLLIGSGVVASLARAQASADPASVIAAYETARNRRDVDGALAYFADDASVSVRNTQYTGKDEIRKYLDGPITRSRFVVVADRQAAGDRVTWTERSGTQGPSPSGATQSSNAPLNRGVNTASFAVSVEAVVQDGKIRTLTYMLGNQPARVDAALEGRAQLPAVVGLASVLAVLLAVVTVASFGLSRSAGSPSTLRGRLLHDLQGWTAARQAL